MSALGHSEMLADINKKILDVKKKIQLSGNVLMFYFTVLLPLVFSQNLYRNEEKQIAENKVY